MAETFQDLVVRSDERRSVWQTLRERANESQPYHAQSDLPELDLDPVSLEILLGIRDQQGTNNFDQIYKEVRQSKLLVVNSVFKTYKGVI